MFDDFFAQAHGLTMRGVPFATATVVRAEKPTSGKPGDKAIVTLDGVMVGWIGGSCAQPTVVMEAQRAIADDQSRLIRLSPDPENENAPDGVQVVRMTCYSGGTLDVYIEPQQPRPHLVVVGHLPVAQALAHLGHAMRYRVTAVVPSGEGTAMEHADAVTSDLSALGTGVTPLTFIVIATHGNDDESAAEQALRGGASYVGLVASRKRGDQLRTALSERGLDDNAIARLRAPAGLDLGARRGDEIALSIMAEVVQHRRGVDALTWTPEPASCCGSRATEEAASTTTTDPVCGMAVRVEGARHTHLHAGTRYAFCCAGCLERFASAPASFVEATSPT